MASLKAKILVDISDRNTDLFYATRFFAMDVFAFVAIGDEKIMIINDMEYGRAVKTAAVDTIYSFSQLRNGANNGHGNHLLQMLATLLKKRGVQTVCVPDTFSVLVADGLRSKGYAMEIMLPPFFPERELKTTAEISQIEAAQEANDRAMERSAAILRESRIDDGRLLWQGQELTAEVLRQEIALTLLNQGYSAPQTIVASGLQGSDPHEIGHGPIVPHQPIIIDIFPRSPESGYFADMTRTFVKGNASRQVKEFYQAVLEAQLAALAIIRSGIDAKVIHETVVHTFDHYGYRTRTINGRLEGYFHGTGHGVGLDIHEGPHVCHLSETLRPGHVITIEPGLYYHEQGAVRLEDIGVVTENGFKNFTRSPKFLEIP